MKKQKQRKEPEKPIEARFLSYTAYHQNLVNRWVQGLCVPLLLFGLSGLIWFIPFPHLAFLGKYNGFVNWFTFFMAILIYCYYRLSPMLSYFMLITFGLFSYLFVQLEYWEQAGGPGPWSFCLAIFVFAIIARLVGQRVEGKGVSLADNIRLLFIGPLWLWRSVFVKLGLRY